MMTNRGESSWKAHLRTTLSSLLNRSRLSLPCPIPFETVYKSAFPGSVAIQSTCRKDGLTQFGRDMALANLMRCTTTSRMVVFTLHAPCEAPTNDPRMYFWMKVPWGQDLIAPPIGSSLFISPEMRADVRLAKWQADCEAMDAQIEMYTFRIYEFARLVDNYTERDALWPELGRMIPFEEPRTKKDAAMSKGMAKHKLHRFAVLKSNFDFILPPDMKRGVEEMLAAAVLLPDSKLMSWAGDPTLEKI